jgi:hypothetical protein
MIEKIYELKTDVRTPQGYWRAGMKKTEAEWRKEFHISDSYPFQWVEEWFIDLSPKEEPEIDEVFDIVRKIFDKKDLHSITYREAAVEACKQCLIYFKNKQ